MLRLISSSLYESLALIVTGLKTLTYKEEETARSDVFRVEIDLTVSVWRMMGTVWQKVGLRPSALLRFHPHASCENLSTNSQPDAGPEATTGGQ